VRAQTTAAAHPATITDVVAPIAFYPDVLVAQVLVASTHPEEIVKAEAWLDGEHPEDTRELAQEIDGSMWRPDIKALALTRPVLDAMLGDFAWTTALGEAYSRNPAEVLRAVQAIRHTAHAAGELTSTSGQRVIVSGATILLEPVDPQFVYVPGRGVFDVAAYERFPWGWHGWQISWKDGAVRYQDAPYLSQH
jgi:hypothetical protein